jgi:hypothetical protein
MRDTMLRRVVDAMLVLIAIAALSYGIARVLLRPHTASRTSCPTRHLPDAVCV